MSRDLGEEAIVIATACQREGINIEELRMGSRRDGIPRVRCEIAEQRVREIGISSAGVARELGGSTSAISKLFARRIQGKERQSS